MVYYHNKLTTALLLAEVHFFSPMIKNIREWLLPIFVLNTNCFLFLLQLIGMGENYALFLHAK